jgi:hypothetical protein
MSRHTEAMLKQMDRLVGQRITGLIRAGENDPEFVGFTTGVYDVWVLCDPEGNGPGFLDIQKKEK